VFIAFNQIIMAQTTTNIENSVLKEVKILQKQDGRSIGRIVSQLLAEALAQRKNKAKASRFKWRSHRLAEAEKIWGEAASAVTRASYLGELPGLPKYP
jgi:hypothetical protein